MTLFESLPITIAKQLIELALIRNYSDQNAKVTSIIYDEEKIEPFCNHGEMQQIIEITVRINGKSGGMLIGWSVNDENVMAFIPAKDENGKGIDYRTPTL